MSDVPSWKDLIDMVSDAVNTVDDNAKRESDRLRADIVALREELNKTRDDIMLNRTEMATLRGDMATFKSDLIASDDEQCDQIKEIQIKSGILEGTKAKVITIVGTILTIIAAVALKILEIL